jgi:hypothetical protein
MEDIELRIFKKKIAGSSDAKKWASWFERGSLR